MKVILPLITFFLFTANVIQGQNITGERQQWHKITLSFNGPNTSETASANPFSDYRLDVIFTHSSGASYQVPGYYAACDNPAETSCDTGNIWKVHFAPDRTGTWNYSTSFKSGNDVAVSGGGATAGFMDGTTGSFQVAASDKSGTDFRAGNKGRLQYVGEHYLRHSGTTPDSPNGPWFVKAGADAPENTLAYEDFDATPNRGDRRKSWSPHQQDYRASQASTYTWANGKGSELLGALNYLSETGVNAFSFLTFSLHGDDENVFPHLLKVSISTYNGYGDAQQWSNGVYHDRFDVSKLAQWERIFQYADQEGLYLHFKSMETENDNIMDNNSLGRERKLYYRELIARFGHHLALNWNITEETTLPDQVTKDIAAYIKETDPYDHHIVLHTYPGQQNLRYDPLLGNASQLTGPSLQTDKNNVHSDVKRWREKSSNAGKKWVIANDEQGSANIGVDSDPNDLKLVRNQVLWGALMAGGAGVEYYYGYGTGVTDLNAEDHRSRDDKYRDASYALDFFNEYLQDVLSEMEPNDGLTATGADYVLAKADELYAVYLPNGGSTGITLPNGNWEVQWYNPREGGGLTAPAGITDVLAAPDSDDWVALIRGDADAGDGGDDCDNVLLNPTQDAYLQGNTRFNTAELRVESGYRLTYLQYDLSAVENDILEATLELQVAGDNGQGLIEIYLGDSNNWTENNLSSANKPQPVELLGTSNANYNLNQTYTWSLTDVAAGGTISLIVIQNGGNDVSFSSAEGSMPPKLRLRLDCGTLGIPNGNLTEGQVRLYPNPAQERIYFDGITTGKVSIYDILGREVIQATAIETMGDRSVNVAGLAPGVYFMAFEDLGTVRFVKQ